MFKRLRSLFHVLASRPHFEDGMTEELRFHIEQYTEDLVRSGMKPEEAQRRARMEFGGINTIKSDCRQARGLRLFDEFARELRYAVRLLRKTPGFTVTALLTLALCLGANLTIFAVIDSALLRPLPFPEPGRLVTIFNTYPKAGVDRDGSSITNYYERRGRIPAFSSLSIYRFGTSIVGDAGTAKREQITQISPDFFTTLGVGPAFGRTVDGRGDDLSNRQCRYSQRCLLAATFQRRPSRDWTADSGRHYSQNRNRRPPSRLPVSLLGSPAVFTACFAS